MVPFALMGMELLTEHGERLEIRAVDLSVLGFTFRLARRQAGLAARARKFLVRMHNAETSEYDMIPLADFDLSEEEQDEFFTLFRVETQDEAFACAAKRLMRDMQDYTRLKLSGDGAALSQARLGYPAEKEGVFSQSLARQKRGWFEHLFPDETWMRAAAAIPETAIFAERPEQYARFLQMDIEAYRDAWFAESGLGSHPIARRRITHMVFGHGTCPLLVPEDDLLLRLLERAGEQRLGVLLQLAPADEAALHRHEKTLDMLKEKGLFPEIIVQDWGTVALAGKRGFPVILGTLLNKRRRDSRLSCLPGQDGGLLDENALNADFFAEHLEKMGVRGAVCEACGYPYALPKVECMLQLPFYQMNTAGHCTLYAACRNGARGKQEAVRECPEYCRERTFLYPDFLRMAGRDNGVYGLDREILTDGAYLMRFAAQGVRRMMIGLL